MCDRYPIGKNNAAKQIMFTRESERINIARQGVTMRSDVIAHVVRKCVMPRCLKVCESVIFPIKLNSNNGTDKSRNFLPARLLISSTSPRIALVLAVYRERAAVSVPARVKLSSISPVFFNTRSVPAPATYPPTVCVLAVKLIRPSFRHPP